MHTSWYVFAHCSRAGSVSMDPKHATSERRYSTAHTLDGSVNRRLDSEASLHSTRNISGEYELRLTVSQPQLN